MSARSTDPSTWTEQERADLVVAMQNIADGISAAAENLNAAFGSLTDAINAVVAAENEITAGERLDEETSE